MCVSHLWPSLLEFGQVVRAGTSRPLQHRHHLAPGVRCRRVTVDAGTGNYGVLRCVAVCSVCTVCTVYGVCGVYGVYGVVWCVWRVRCRGAERLHAPAVGGSKGMGGDVSGDALHLCVVLPRPRVLARRRVALLEPHSVAEALVKVVRVHTPGLVVTLTGSGP